MTLKYRMFSSEGEALIPGAGSLRSLCVSLMIRRGRLLLAIGSSRGGSFLLSDECGAAKKLEIEKE